MFTKLIVLLFIACCFAFPVASQVMLIDLSEVQSKSPYTNQEVIYDLYDGKEYFHYASTLFNSHPFYINPEFTTGDVEYKGKLFKDLPLLYDLVTDQLVLLSFNDFFRIQLYKPEVNSFTIAGGRFVNFNTAKHAGFFQELHKGKIPIYAKRIKRIKENLEEKNVRRYVIEEHAYYFLKSGELVSIKNVKALLNEMGDRRNEVMQYLKKNKIRKNKELAIVTAASYYDQITTHEN